VRLLDLRKHKCWRVIRGESSSGEMGERIFGSDVVALLKEIAIAAISEHKETSKFYAIRRRKTCVEVNNTN
jgi:hypothetical protein